MSSSSKRIGLVGLSAKGSWAALSHIHYLIDTPYYNIVALQNSIKESAKAAADAFKLQDVAVYGDPATFVSDPNVDIVVISVKVPARYEIVKHALEAKKDIFVEWPMARTLNDAEEFVKLARANNLRTPVGLQARQSPAVIKAKELVESGKLGKITGSHMYGHGWRNTESIPFGHAVDALCYVLGEVESLVATRKNMFPEISLLGKDGSEIHKVNKTAYDHVSFTGTLLHGGIVDVTYVGGFSRTGRNFFWEIIGTEGSLVLTAAVGHIHSCEPTLEHVDGAGKRATIEVEKSDIERNEPYMHPGDLAFNVGRAWDAWAGDEAAKAKGASVVTFEDALIRHRMLGAIARSDAGGTRERYL